MNNLDDYNEALTKSVKVFSSIGVGIADTQNPDTDEPTVIGYLLVDQPLPCCFVLSQEMMDNLIVGLQNLREQVTFSARVVAHCAEDEDRVIN